MRCVSCFVEHPPHHACTAADLWNAKELRAKHGGQAGAVAHLDALLTPPTKVIPKPSEIMKPLRVPENVMLRPVMLPAEEKEAPKEPVTLPDVTLQPETDEFMEFKRRLRLANRDRVRRHRARKAEEKKNAPPTS